MAPPASRPGSKRPSRSEVRRRVLAAAAEVFAERGMAAATLDEVALAGGLTKGAIYSNFAGKDALILALMDQAIDQREQVAGAAARVAGTGPEAAAAAGAALVALQAQQVGWQLLFIEFWLRAQRDREVLALFAKRRRAARRELAAAIAAHLDSHGLRSALSEDELAITVLALSNGLELERLTDPGSVPDDLLGKLLTRLLG